MYKTKIDWCDSTWNPVTGCFHDCEYCYARKIANRFALPYAPSLGDPGMEGAAKWDSDAGMDTMLELEKPYKRDGRTCMYPMGFYPTFHRYRLDVPKRWTEPRTIFVCSMADLFGEWVPDDWIEDVFRAAKDAPQHRYLFLTKNPGRYSKLPRKWFDGLDAWIGTTVCQNDDVHEKGRILSLSETWNRGVKWFVSVEPLLEEMDLVSLGQIRCADWVIVGAESGHRTGKVKPRKEWIGAIAAICTECRVPVFMKESVKQIMGEEFRQEWPWEGEDAE